MPPVKSAPGTTPPLPPPVPDSEWRMPQPKSHTVVWKHADGSRGECTGFITRRLGRMLDLHIYAFDSERPIVKTGVRHSSDPDLKRMSLHNTSGVWDFTEEELERQAKDKKFEEFMEWAKTRIGQLG